MQQFMMRLHDLAMVDPVQALMFARGYQKRPVTLNSTASFSSLSLGQIPVSQPLDQQVTRRTWVDNLTYNLSLPNAFIGNVFQPQAMASLLQNTGISLRQTIMSGPRFLVTDTFTPLENYANAMQTRWSAGWQIMRNQQVLNEFMLTAIPFGDVSNTPPYTCVLTFNAWQFDDFACDEMSCEEAQVGLVKRGILKQIESDNGKKCFCPNYKD